MKRTRKSDAKYLCFLLFKAIASPAKLNNMKKESSSLFPANLFYLTPAQLKKKKKKKKEEKKTNCHDMNARENACENLVLRRIGPETKVMNNENNLWPEAARISYKDLLRDNQQDVKILQCI